MSAGAPTTPAARASRARAGTEIYERLKQDIVGLHFLPGERLVELELCDRYDVSRTPVREALRRLEDDGLVVMRPKGGRFVRGHDVTDYEDVYAVRATLEAFAVDELCKRAPEIDLDFLRDAWREGYPAASAPLDGSYVTADERFHLAIAQQTGNSYLASSLERINDRLRGIRSVDFTVRERLLTSEAQHLAIVAAIAQGDAGLAAELARGHIEQSKDEIRGILLRILSKAYADRDAQRRD
ncbi:MAG: GntR family transcriptional regulator [Solirubrobacteraceae bacterium]